MPTNKRYAFFHAPSKTFVEVKQNVLVALRFEGRRVRKLGEVDDVHINDQVAMSRAGIVSYGDSYGDLGLVDVTGNKLRPLRKMKGRGQVITPDGKRVWDWRYNENDEPDNAILSFASRGKLDQKMVWHGMTDSPRRVNPHKVGKPGKVEKRGEISYKPELAIADDGKHWAALQSDHIVLGVGKRTVTVCFEADSVDFWPERYTFDAGRLLIGGKGITALAFDGRVVATSPLKVCSAPVRVGDDLLVVRKCDDAFSGSETELVRLDPKTLKLRGPVAGVPRRKEAGDAESAIVPLRKNAFAWSLGDAPVMIVGLDVVPSELVTTPEAAAMQLGGPPNATHEQLEAKVLLETLARDHKFNRLLDGGAFRPYADQVCGWSDERLARLVAIGPQEWWQVAAGASDATVDGLVKAVKAGGPQREARFRLLCGVDSDYALAAIGPLAKKELAGIAVASNFAIERGKAIRRFAPGGFVVVAGKRATKGLDYMQSAKSLLVDPTGATCKAAPWHLLAVDVGLLPGKPLAKTKLKTQHVFLSGCGECDEWMWEFYFKPSGTKLKRVGPENDKERCAGESSKPESKKKLALVPLTESPRDTCGRVGGRPDWVQSPAVPDCAECGLPMFFVAQANMYWVMGNLPGGTVFSFQCERCALITQLIQFT